MLKVLLRVKLVELVGYVDVGEFIEGSLDGEVMLKWIFMVKYFILFGVGVVIGVGIFVLIG